MLLGTVEHNKQKYKEMPLFVMLLSGLALKSVSVRSGFPQVLVKGSVQCRRGILMLTADNVTVLGGEVDALVETNTPVNSLKQAMYV